MCREITFWTWGKKYEDIRDYLKKLGLTEPMEFDVVELEFDGAKGHMICLSSVTEDKHCLCNINKEQKEKLIQIIDDLTKMNPYR